MGLMDMLNDYDWNEGEERRQFEDLPLDTNFLVEPLDGKSALRLAELPPKEGLPPLHMLKGGFKVVGGPAGLERFLGKPVFADEFIYDYNDKSAMSRKLVGLFRALLIPGVGDGLEKDARAGVRRAAFDALITEYEEAHSLSLDQYGVPSALVGLSREERSNLSVEERMALGQGVVRMVVDIASALVAERGGRVLLRRYATKKTGLNGQPRLANNYEEAVGPALEKAGVVEYGAGVDDIPF